LPSPVGISVRSRWDRTCWCDGHVGRWRSSGRARRVGAGHETGVDGPNSTTSESTGRPPHHRHPRAPRARCRDRRLSTDPLSWLQRADLGLPPTRSDARTQVRGLADRVGIGRRHLPAGSRRRPGPLGGVGERLQRTLVLEDPPHGDRQAELRGVVLFGAAEAGKARTNNKRSPWCSRRPASPAGRATATFTPTKKSAVVLVAADTLPASVKSCPMRTGGSPELPHRVESLLDGPDLTRLLARVPRREPENGLMG
jgi:hypothetical protein